MNPPSATAALFQQWLAEHRGIIVKVTRSFARTAADAADLRQEVLLQLWTSLPAYAGQAKPSTWIYRVSLNTALTWRRGHSRREKRFPPQAADFEPVVEQTSPAEAAGDRELLAKLYAGIHALAESDRVLMLLSLDGLAYREIADITGQNENQIGVALTRARQRLGRALQEVTDELE